MIATAKIHKENLRRAAGEGFINATDCADYLVRKGLGFRDAYRITGELVAYCIENGKTLETLSLEEYRGMSPAFGQDVYDTLLLERCIDGRKSAGGPAEEAVLQQIEEIDKWIGETEHV